MPHRIPYDEKVALTRRVLRTLERWEIPPAEQCLLLGLTSQGVHRRLRRFRLGNPLPDEPDVWARVALLLRLDNALSKLFPHSAISAGLWVTTPRAKFGHRAPLDLMLEGGLQGIRSVERSLDNLDLL